MYWEKERPLVAMAILVSLKYAYDMRWSEVQKLG